MTHIKFGPFACVLTMVSLTSCQPMKTVEVRPVSNPQLESLGQETQDYYKAGKTHLAFSDYGLAIDSFRKSLQIDGSNVAALNGLAIAYDMLGRFDLSQKYYQKALDIDPQSSMTLSNLSYSLHAQGEHEDALQVAYLAKKVMVGGDEKDNQMASVVAKNIAIAEKMTEFELEQRQAEEEYYTAIERTSAREWEVIQKKVHPPRKSMIHKASFSVDEIIDRATDKAVAHEGKEATARHQTYRILNGAGRPKMAKRMAAFMNEKDLKVWAYANAQYFGYQISIINFTPGYRAEAEKMAALLPIPVEIKEANNLKADVELILGEDLLTFDSSLYNGQYDI